MKHPSTAGPLARPRLTAALAAAAFMLGACGTADGDAPLENPGAEGKEARSARTCVSLRT